MDSSNSPSQLNNSDFWRLCHDLHPYDYHHHHHGNPVDDDGFVYPSTTPISPATIVGVAIKRTLKQSNDSNRTTSILSGTDQRISFGSFTSIIDKESNEFEECNELKIINNESDSHSNDSLQNLFVKQTEANKLFIETHSNKVNTQRIFDTIKLIGDNKDAIPHNENELKNGVSEIKCIEKMHRITVDRGDEYQDNDMISNDSTSISNADDLLEKIATDLNQLKVNVSEIDELRDQKETSMQCYFDGDLIDFNDDCNSENLLIHTNGKGK